MGSSRAEKVVDNATRKHELDMLEYRTCSDTRWMEMGKGYITERVDLINAWRA